MHKAATPSNLVLAWIVAGSMFMAQLDSTIIATALPQMAKSFGTEPTNLSLGVSIYLLVQAVLMPASNWVSGRFGARRVFAIAVLLFTIASVLCGLSATLWQFVLARIAQGAAAALMTPVGRVVLVRSTPREQLVHILTLTSVPMLVAPMLGPPVGGFIVSYLSWPWVFYLNVPFGLACVALILRHVPDLREDEARPFDFAGFALLGLALTGLIYGLDRITAPRNSHLFAGLCVAGGLVFGAAAIRHVLRAAHPLLSLRPFESRIFGVIAGGGGFFARLPMRAVPFVMPLAFQVGMGMSAFMSGVLLMASAGGDIVLKPLVRGVLRRFGFRASLIWSQIGSSIAVALLGAALTGASPAVFFVLLAATGVARSILFSGMSALLYAELDEADTGAATVLWNVTQQVTNALAVSFSVILLNLLAWQRGDYGGHSSLGDFRATLMLLALLGASALFAFRRLPPDAGSALSGHRQPARYDD